MLLLHASKAAAHCFPLRWPPIRPISFPINAKRQHELQLLLLPQALLRCLRNCRCNHLYRRRCSTAATCTATVFLFLLQPLCYSYAAIVAAILCSVSATFAATVAAPVVVFTVPATINAIVVATVAAPPRCSASLQNGIRASSTSSF